MWYYPIEWFENQKHVKAYETLTFWYFLEGNGIKKDLLGFPWSEVITTCQESSIDLAPYDADPGWHNEAVSCQINGELVRVG